MLQIHIQPGGSTRFPGGGLLRPVVIITGLIVALPLALLVLALLLVGVVVLILLAVVWLVVAVLRGLLRAVPGLFVARDDGRRNVRVVERVEP